jgi:pheromone A receptor
VSLTRYLVLVIWRLCVVRRQLDSILETRTLRKANFFRLLFISFFLIIAPLPLSIGSVYRILVGGMHRYSWTEVHSDWAPIHIPTFGQVGQKDGVVSIILGYLMFICFGLGQEAVETYKSWLRFFGLQKCFPAFLPGLRKSSPSASRLKWNSIKSNLLRSG